MVPQSAEPNTVPLCTGHSGNALTVLGERESGTERLEQAVTAHRNALDELIREHVPLDGAMTQNNLGTALRTLGERESGTERLEQAVTAYHAAIEEYTRERVPLRWAMTQNNLGTALSTLGERESGNRAPRAGGHRLSQRPRGIHPRVRVLFPASSSWDPHVI